MRPISIHFLTANDDLTNDPANDLSLVNAALQRGESICAACRVMLKTGRGSEGENGGRFTVNNQRCMH